MTEAASSNVNWVVIYVGDSCRNVDGKEKEKEKKMVER